MNTTKRVRRAWRGRSHKKWGEPLAVLKAKDAPKPVAEHPPYVTITKGGRGFFAVLVWWNPDHGGFYEPWQSGIGSYSNIDETEPEAKCWAAAEGVEYRRPK